MLFLVGAALVVALFAFLCLCYVALMNLKRIKRRDGRVHLLWVCTIGPFGVIGYVLGDILLMNVIVASIVYRELPRERTFSERIQRHFLEEPGRAFTRWFALRLNEIDDTPHIHGPE